MERRKSQRSALVVREKTENGMENGLANLWNRKRITKKARAGRGLETIWEIPVQMEAIKKALAGLFVQSPGKQEALPMLPGGLVPITQFCEQDVFIVGYPKSGNTWFQDIVSGLAFGMLPEFAPESLDLIPDVHHVAHYKRYATPMYFKSHFLPTPDYKRIVYLLRDGRDVMVSYHRFLVDLMNVKVDFLEAVETGKVFFPCKWHEHVQAWLANPFNAEMIVIKYEALNRNATHELQRFCDFVGLKRPPEFIKTIAEQTAFEKMRDREIKWRLSNPKLPKDKFFRRRGVVGSYKDEMPPEVLSVFMKDSADTLRRCGYL